MSKKVVILGSTGSIGQSAIDVCTHLGYTVVGLAAHSNLEVLRAQIDTVHPSVVALYDEAAAHTLQQQVSCPVLAGEAGVIALAQQKEADIVVAAIVGTKGIRPVAAALSQGTDVALANKESLVSAGPLLKSIARETGAQILPVDSEHSALFQCLVGEEMATIHSLTLTASGGPFLHAEPQKLATISVADALRHPTWQMGVKNTIDSSTLMNKGLEVIEAHHLFEIPLENIEVVIHPQSLIHSFVTFQDGSSKAQISNNDMKLPIQYALSYPHRLPGIVPPLSFSSLSRLDFHPPDTLRFPCLRLAMDSLREGGSMPCFMNAANEVLVRQFVDGAISWLDIGTKLERLMERHSVESLEGIEHVLSIDAHARACALKQ